ncbi:MAG TPA: pantoate--beta-alanine ligase [Actinomycetota bacterium]|nr:pantoate--beta-alanine ligase [Actinomycetota bacterium]
MKTVSLTDEVREAVRAARERGLDVGFVPTMGYLHEGHLELMRTAKHQNGFVVLSIFVNPLQFGPHEDLEKYPRDPEGDAAKASGAVVDLIFTPPVEEMYPAGPSMSTVDVGPIGEAGEGKFRPGHFNGVATVCTKLFSIVGPDRVYFGRKDAQQLAVIRQIVRDLNLPVQVVPCETVREPDGLAMSSRNAYLSAEEREAAPAIYRALEKARNAFSPGGPADALKEIVAREISKEPALRLEYAEVFDSETFEPVTQVAGGATIAVAAYLGGTRLIDNIEVG